MCRLCFHVCQWIYTKCTEQIFVINSKKKKKISQKKKNAICKNHYWFGNIAYGLCRVRWPKDPTEWKFALQVFSQMIESNEREDVKKPPDGKRHDDINTLTDLNTLCIALFDLCSRFHVVRFIRLAMFFFFFQNVYSSVCVAAVLHLYTHTKKISCWNNDTQTERRR